MLKMQASGGERIAEWNSVSFVWTWHGRSRLLWRFYNSNGTGSDLHNSAESCSSAPAV